MEKIDTLSSSYIAALAELTGFIEASETASKEPEKKKHHGFEDKEPVPRKEAVPDEDSTQNEKDAPSEEEPADENAETKDKKEQQDDGQDFKSATGDMDSTARKPKKDTVLMDEEDVLMDDDEPFKAENPKHTEKEEQEEKEKVPEVKEKPEAEKSTKPEETAPDSENQDKQEIVKSNFGQNKLSEDVAPRPRYVDATDLAVTISVDCAKQAVAAMRALRELLTGERPVLLVRITDDGTRELSTYKSKEAAAMAMHTEMDIYINEIEPKDYSQIVYVDDGEDGPHLHDTTPPEQVAEDGTLKRPSEMDNTLHRIETDDRGIVYFETKNATSRWDIYDMNDAMIGDPSDPEYDGFKEKMMESAKEKAEENQEPKKKKTKTAKKSNMFGKKQ